MSIKLGGPARNWWVYIGRSDYDQRFCIVVCFGFVKDAPDYEIPWRHHWRWTPTFLPPLVFYQRRIRGRRFVYPCGIKVGSRYLMLPFH